MGERVVKIPKNLLGVLWQDKLGIKRIVSKNWIYFRKCIFCHKTPKHQKNVFKVWNNIKFSIFYSFYKGDLKQPWNPRPQAVSSLERTLGSNKVGQVVFLFGQKSCYGGGGQTAPNIPFKCFDCLQTVGWTWIWNRNFFLNTGAWF